MEDKLEFLIVLSGTVDLTGLSYNEGVSLLELDFASIRRFVGILEAKHNKIDMSSPAMLILDKELIEKITIQMVGLPKPQTQS